MITTETTKHADRPVLDGLILLGESTLGNSYKKYKLIGCSHEKDIRVSRALSGNFRCTVCADSRILAIASEMDLTVVGDADNKKSGYKKYRFNACQHEQDLRTDHVKSGSFKCNQCLLEKISLEANQCGLQLVGNGGRGKDYRLYRFLSCGHFAELSVFNVRTSNVRCSKCVQAKREAVARSKGLEIVGKSVKSSDYLLYRLPCGHVQDFSIQNVSNNEFSCFECGEHSWTKPSSVYVLRISVNSFTWLKVGYSNSLTRRIKQYGLPSNVSIDIIHNVYCETARLASHIESRLFTQCLRYKISPDVMSTYHTISGRTECYDLEALPIIEEILNAV